MRNNMGDFVDDTEVLAVDHPGNAMLLRADLHQVFDRRAWVPFLKDGKLVACTACKPRAVSSQFRSHHNHALQELTGVSKECIFARVAWAVIPLLRPFLEKRRVQDEVTVVLDSKGNVKELTKAELGLYAVSTGSGSRRSSPTKRARSGPGADDCGGSFDDSAYHGSEDDVDSPPRGRKRRRTFDDIEEALVVRQ